MIIKTNIKEDKESKKEKVKKAKAKFNNKNKSIQDKKDILK